MYKDKSDDDLRKLLKEKQFIVSSQNSRQMASKIL